MVNLTTDDRQDLIDLLKALPELADENSRREMLEYAGLKKLLPQINLSGSAFTASNAILSYLANYGYLTYDREALGQFLNSIKRVVGVQQKEFLNRILTEYNLMTPIVPSPSLDNWQGTDTTTTVLEKIIGENTLRPIAFLEQGLQVARSVAYLRVSGRPKPWSGTGFLIASDLILTNHHVMPSAELLPGALFRFNYQENFNGEAQQPREYRAKVNGLYHANQALDYAVIQLEGEPGKEWGWLSLLPRNISKDERVNIIQHPDGQPKQISLQNNFVEYVGGDVVQYVTSTMGGSSGSPVLNDGWEVVALHHAGGNLREPTTQRKYFRNEGILVRSILADLPTEINNLLRATGN
jgi:V8-like Glu-specific endopeptidase